MLMGTQTTFEFQRICESKFQDKACSNFIIITVLFTRDITSRTASRSHLSFLPKLRVPTCKRGLCHLAQLEPSPLAWHDH